ncbi:MAG: transglutaminase domain-containing protein [bacterium]|nr:transglutaminase domain-containing protein [bacterium]
MTAPAVTTTEIPSGDAGTFATLRQMRRMVNASLTSPLVRDAATKIASEFGGRDYVGHATGIRRWLTDHMQYVPDPRGVELVHSPQVLLRRIESTHYVQGDCDDIAVLGAALGKSIGLRARFVVLGFRRGGGYSHVYTILRTPKGWVDLDISKPPSAPAVLRADALEV